MRNEVSLYALAYIQENSNPYTVFCNLIQYVLYKSKEKQLTEQKLIDDLYENFGIRIPRSIIKNSTSILCANKTIEKHNVYKLVSCTLKVDEFERQMQNLRIQEVKLVKSISEFISLEFSQHWDNDRILKSLSKIFSLGDYSATLSLFSNDNIKFISDKNTDEYCIKRYLQKITTEKGEEFYSVLNIVRGIIIILGISQDDMIQSRRKRKDTQFYIDTKFALRLLGYSTTANVEEAKEIVDIIKDKYEGKICIFNRTIREMVDALKRAGLELEEGYLSNYEMKQFSDLKNYNSLDFSIAADSVKDELIRNGITIVDDIDWGKHNVQSCSIDTEKLIKFIEDKYPTWKKQSIVNDVYIINQINFLRRGHYECRYGGERKLPIFITTNIALVDALKQYAKMHCDDGECPFSEKNIPIITTDGIACAIWTNLSLKDDLPLVKLSQIAYSAQQTDVELFDRINETVKDLKEKHQEPILNLDERRREKLFDLIYKNSGGNIDDITNQVVANSFEELIQIELIDKNEEIKKLQNDVQTKEKSFLLERQNAVDIAVDRLKNKIGFCFYCRCVLFKYWWLITDIFIVFVGSFVEYIVNEKGGPRWISLIATVILGLIPPIINYFKSGKLIENLRQKIRRRILNDYLNCISKKMSPVEQAYKKEILEECEKYINVKMGNKKSNNLIKNNSST